MCYILIALLTFILILLSNPLRKSNENIRKDLLKIMPIGTNMEEIIEQINKNKKWEIHYINNDKGYGIDKSGTPGYNRDFISV